MDSLRSDLRYACRRLLGSPGFAAIAVLSIALGVGASTAVFSAVRGILFAALPYPQPQRVVALSDRDSEGGPLPLTYGTFRELAQRSRSLERLAVADRWQPALVTAGADPERVDGDRVTADYFRVLGVAPAVGRDFDAADDRPGGPAVAIVSESLASRRFGGAAAILNRPIVLDGVELTVVGVMPAGFKNALTPTAELWAPAQYRDHAAFQEGGEWGHHMRGIARLAPNVTLEQAENELGAIARTPVAEFPRPPWASMQRGLIIEPLRASMTSAVRPALLAILGAVMLLLVIACVNVSNLFLARALARRAELAVRTALGAGRARLTRQLVTESLLVSLVGGLAGLGVASAFARALLSLAPPELARAGAFELDAFVFATALCVSTLVGVAAGAAPALGVRENMYVAVRSGSHATDGGHRVVRRALVVTQVALAFVLLASTGLLFRSVERLLATAPGFDAENVLTMRVVATGRRYGSSAELAELFDRELEAVRAVPGVVAAAFTTQLPLSGDFDNYGVVFESLQRDDPRNAGAALRYVVTPGWFETMRIPLKQGRLLEADDRPGAPQAVLINESFAKRRFGDRSPIGQRLRMGPYILQADGPWAVVVGVVGDVKQASLALDSPDAVYFAMGQWAWIDQVQSLAIRTRGDPAALVQSVQRAIWSVDPTPPVVRVATMRELVDASEAQRSFALVIFAAFALSAIVLAVVGLYGVLARSVEERRRELGVRAALGASPARVAGHVVSRGMALAGAGIFVGVLGAAVVTRGLSSLLFGVSPLDEVTFGGTIALLAGVSLLACGVPAARAARVDPTVTLRAE
jgi:predicted permease